MKAFLLYRSRDFDLKKPLPPNAAELIQDLELRRLFEAMAGGDQFLLDVADKTVLSSLHEPEEVLYRQSILADCLENPEIVQNMYAISVEAIERERKIWGWMLQYPDSVLHRSVEVLEIFLEQLKKLRQTAEEHQAKFHSEGFVNLFQTLVTELNDEYLGSVEGHLRRLGFRKSVLISAELGSGNRGIGYMLRKPHEARRGWKDRVQSWIGKGPRSGYVYQIAERDEAGARALSELRGQGIANVAAALGQSTDHILSFFNMLRLELAFYVGCLNLHYRLARNDEPICFPEPSAPSQSIFSVSGLYDLCLSLTLDGRVVGNDVAGNGKTLVMITGANRGGKSTFLRSAGIAQLMMQCGMFVPAQSFRANLCEGIFTHFKREEDTSMRSGKLDEELSRMSSIADQVPPNGIVLFNESFASTNEREGSEIARQIVRALLQTGVKVFYVTHLFDLAQGFHATKMASALFLRAERLADGQRTFRVIEGEPLPTSYGEDLYGRIFGTADDLHLSRKSS